MCFLHIVLHLLSLFIAMTFLPVVLQSFYQRHWLNWTMNCLHKVLNVLKSIYRTLVHISLHNLQFHVCILSDQSHFPCSAMPWDLLRHNGTNMRWLWHPVNMWTKTRLTPPCISHQTSQPAAAMASSYPPPFEGAGEVKEGFLCPLCLKDLQSFYQLQEHYEEEHSGDDRHVRGQLKSEFSELCLWTLITATWVSSCFIVRQGVYCVLIIEKSIVLC